ncbi:MAG: helix-turn-helix domain-containing protein, partial [Aristaeellaceae bacterium]
LTNKEYQVMELLISNPGRLISSEQLLERIWGYDNAVEINVVWSYISYLRKKLAGLKADVRIQVSRNAGYTLEKIP